MKRIRARYPDHGKRISAVEPKIDFDRQKPIFCLRYIDPEYCISKCDKDDKAAFADKLLQMSQMTWVEIRMAHRHGAGAEKIARDSIHRPIPESVPEDAPLLAFRFSGKKPMVGYRMQNLFHILWFDRDFTLYDHD